MAQRIIRIQQSLKVAAEAADINGLYGSIKEDPLVLDRIDAIPFVDTPLHIAASAGHTDFAIEILRLKPSFGRKLNPDGLSSLHLALISDKFETAKRLIKFDKELIRVKGKEGITPLHFIAEQQHREEDRRLNTLAEFLFAYPDSIEDLINRNETVLDIAVKTKNQRAVQVILGCICRIGRTEVLEYVNVQGNDASDMAESEIVRSLRCARGSSVWLMQIVRSLCCAGTLKCSSPDPSLAEFLNSPERPLEVLYKPIIRVRRSVSMELRNIGLVVAVLIATATFQAVLSPPGGVGGPGNNNLLTNGSSINATVSSTNHLFAANASIVNATFFIPTTDDPVKRLIGRGQATYGNFFCVFYVFNTWAFILSMLMIMFLLPLWPFVLLHGALFFLMLSYGFSFSVISPSNGLSEFFQIVSIVYALDLYLCRVVIYQTHLTRMARNKRLRMLECLMNNVGP